MSDMTILRSENISGNVHEAVAWVNRNGYAPEEVHSIIPTHSPHYTIVVLIVPKPLPYEETDDDRR